MRVFNSTFHDQTISLEPRLKALFILADSCAELYREIVGGVPLKIPRFRMREFSRAASFLSFFHESSGAMTDTRPDLWL